MYIECDHCQTGYELELPAAALASGRSVKFRCSACGHSFHVVRDGRAVADAPRSAPPAPPASAVLQHVLLRQGGVSYHVPDVATLQRWVVERRVAATDELDFGGGRWVRAGERPDLAPFFAIVTEAETASRRLSALAEAQALADEARTGGVPIPDALPPIEDASMAIAPLGRVAARSEAPANLFPPPSRGTKTEEDEPFSEDVSSAAAPPPATPAQPQTGPAADIVPNEWAAPPEDGDIPNEWAAPPEDGDIPNEWATPPEDGDIPNEWAAPPEDGDIPNEWATPPEEGAIPDEWATPPEEGAIPDEWAIPPDEGAIPDQWATPPEEGAIPDQWAIPPDEGAIPDQWAIPPDEGAIPDQWATPPDEGAIPDQWATPPEGKDIPSTWDMPPDGKDIPSTWDMPPDGNDIPSTWDMPPDGNDIPSAWATPPNEPSGVPKSWAIPPDDDEEAFPGGLGSGDDSLIDGVFDPFPVADERGLDAPDPKGMRASPAKPKSTSPKAWMDDNLGIDDPAAAPEEPGDQGPLYDGASQETELGDEPEPSFAIGEGRSTVDSDVDWFDGPASKPAPQKSRAWMWGVGLLAAAGIGYGAWTQWKPPVPPAPPAPEVVAPAPTPPTPPAQPAAPTTPEAPTSGTPPATPEAPTSGTPPATPDAPTSGTPPATPEAPATPAPPTPPAPPPEPTASRLSPAEALVERGWRSFERGKLSDADKYFRDALVASANYGDAHFGLGYVSEQRGKVDEAVRSYCSAKRTAGGNVSLTREVDGRLAILGRTCN